MKEVLGLIGAISLLTTMALPTLSSFAQMSPTGYNVYSPESGSYDHTSLAQPQIIQPNNDAIKFIDKIFHWGNVRISNSSQGTSLNATATAAGNNVYIAWIGKINDTYHVYLSQSYNTGRNFTSPLEIANSTTGSITNLSACSSGNDNSFVWQEPASKGTTAIWGIISMDHGHTYIKDQISPLDLKNGTAHDPMIAQGNCDIVIYKITDSDGTYIMSWPW